MLFLNHYAVSLLVHPMDGALLISEVAPVSNSRYKHLLILFDSGEANLTFCFLLEVRGVTNLTDTLASITDALPVPSESFPLASTEQ